MSPLQLEIGLAIITAFLVGLAKWTEADMDGIEPLLETIPDRIRREGWVEHSRKLHEQHHGEPLPVRTLSAAAN